MGYCGSGHYDVWLFISSFFPSLKGEELEFLHNFGDVELLFIGKIETWDNINSKIPQDLPQITFPHYKGFSVVDRGEQ